MEVTRSAALANERLLRAHATSIGGLHIPFLPQIAAAPLPRCPRVQKSPHSTRSATAMPSGALRVAAPLAVLLLPFTVSECANQAQLNCSRSCVAENCNSVGIRYGKYCGVGWTGCPGEKPCDDLDACCKVHDKCVEKKGMTSVKCHEKFKSCIRKVKKTGKAGFSKKCPYEVAMPTMIQGMDMAILFSQLGGPHSEL